MTVADISLQYYDKAYGFGIAKRDDKSVLNIPIEKDEPVATAKLLIEILRKEEE